MGRIIPYIVENKSHVPNHQPEIITVFDNPWNPITIHRPLGPLTAVELLPKTRSTESLVEQAFAQVEISAPRTAAGSRGSCWLGEWEERWDPKHKLCKLGYSHNLTVVIDHFFWGGI